MGECGKTKGCAFYSFCTTTGDKAKKECGIYHNKCGMVAAKDCELTETLGRGSLDTYKMFEAIEEVEAKNDASHSNIVIAAGAACLMVSGALLALAVRSWRNRRGSQAEGEVTLE